MADDVTSDQVTEGTGGETAEAPATQGDSALGASKQEGSVAGISVGNQKFADQAAFVKAYQDLQKGYTQTTQKHSEEVKKYEGVSQWLSNLTKSPKQLASFKEWLKAQAGGEQAAPAPAKQADALQNEDNPIVQDLLRRQASLEADYAFEKFQKAHSDLSEQDLMAVVKQVIDWDGEGKERTLDEAYRHMFYEQNAAKLVAAGQKQGEAAAAKSKAATSLGSSPSSAQAAPAKGQRWIDMKGSAQQNDWISKKLDALGAKFDD